MFSIWKRWVSGNNAGKWFRIWESDDGTDCAEYLKTTTTNDKQDGTVEYKMIWQPK